jgi:hypothetical protein
MSPTDITERAAALSLLLNCYSTNDTSPSPSPSPAAPLGPKLALISNFPASYNGSTANLTATSTSNNQTQCIKAPSPRFGNDNVTVVTPGPGLCGSDGSMPQGSYTFDQTVPAGTQFDRWECYNITGNTATAINLTNPSGVDLQGNDVITCVAQYRVVNVSSTCADALPAVPGAQQYNCSRPTMVFNSSAGMMSPATDANCCMVSGS